MKAPPLRFKEFTTPWEEKKLGEIANFSKGKGISKSDTIEEGTTPCIRYGELYTTYNEIIKNVISFTNIPANDLVFSKANDVLIPASGETPADIATATCVICDNIALGGDINIIQSNLNGIFLAYYLNSKLKYKIARLAQGHSVVHLYSSQLSTLSLFSPTLPEQEKIAEFLSAVDKKIEVLEKKVTLLKDFKKGAMQQIFSRKLRFCQPDGSPFTDWQEKKLGDVCYIASGGSNREDSLEFEGKYTFFDRSQDIRTSNKYMFDAEAIIIGGEGREFIPKLFVGKFDLHQRAYAIMEFAENSHRYIFYFISFYGNQYFQNQAVGSTVKSLRLPMFQKMPITLPSLPEQQKIAEFLSSLDEKIEAIENQLKLVYSFKKSLLKQMFV